MYGCFFLVLCTGCSKIFDFRHQLRWFYKSYAPDFADAMHLILQICMHWILQMDMHRILHKFVGEFGIFGGFLAFFFVRGLYVGFSFCFLDFHCIQLVESRGNRRFPVSWKFIIFMRLKIFDFYCFDSNFFNRKFNPRFWILSSCISCWYSLSDESFSDLSWLIYFKNRKLFKLIWTNLR